MPETSAPITRIPRIAVTRAIPRRCVNVIRMCSLLNRLFAVAETNGERRGVPLEFVGAEGCVSLAAHDDADAGDVQHVRRRGIELDASRIEVGEYQAAGSACPERPVRPADGLV